MGASRQRRAVRQVIQHRRGALAFCHLTRAREFSLMLSGLHPELPWH